MTTEENKGIVRRLIEEFNKRNLGVLDETFASNFVFHRAGIEDLRGPEEMKQHRATNLTAFPDLQVTIEDMVAEGDKVVIRSTAIGTHQGELAGMAATGKQATWSGIAIYRIEGGKFVELWQVSDNLGMGQQLGLIPRPGQG